MSRWEASALCAQTDPVLFFPEKGESAWPAKATCQRCEVRPQCLELALREGLRHGVYGGMSARQRVPLHKAYSGHPNLNHQAEVAA